MTASAPSMAKTLNNGSIIRMVGAGLSDDLILQAITSQPGQYTTDADSLVELKEAGVSERVITAMMNKGRKRLTPEGNTAEDPPPAPISEVSEIGAYYKDRKGAWQPLETEVVHIKSGGWLKSTATHGIIREDRNGHLKGRESKLALQAPIEILIYAPTGVDIAEYDFLRFRINSDNREFRVMTGGVFHSTSGADRDEVEFHATQSGPARLAIHHRSQRRRRRVRHPSARNRKRYQRRQDLHLRHHRIDRPRCPSPPDRVETD